MNIKYIISIIYNSFLIALTIAILCFKNEWLQMRVNTGLIFEGLLVVLIVVGLVLYKKKKMKLGIKATTTVLAICSAIGLLVYGFERLKIVPAALVREGIGQTKIPFSTINYVLFVITVLGYIGIVLLNLLRKDNGFDKR